MKIGVKSYGEELKWIDSGDLEINGKKLTDFIAESEKKFNDAVKTIQDLQKKVETDYVPLIEKCARLTLAQAERGIGNEKNPIN